MRHDKMVVGVRVSMVWAVLASACFGQSRGQGDAPPPQSGSARNAAGAGAGAGTGTAGAPAKPVDPAKMEWLLNQWERQSSLLKTLDVVLFRTDYDPAWDDHEYYEGRAIFKAPNLAFIDFRKIKQDDGGKPIKNAKTGAWVSAPHERIQCTGAEVWQYRSDTQQVFIFPLEKDQRQKALEEGPLPFLFNMRANEAKRRYQMTLMSEDAKAYGVSIKPKLEVDKESFSLAFVNLDRKYLLPVRIILVSPDGKSRKDFKLGPMEPNKPVSEKNFQGQPMGPPWKMVRNPAGEERPRAGMPRARRGEPGAGVEPAAPRSSSTGVRKRQ